MSEHRDDRGFVEHWRRFGPILEKIRREEQREFDPERDFQIMEGLLEIAFAHSIPQPTSGMFEMQRLFAKGRP